MKPIPQKELDQGCDLFGRPITVGTKVRSHDFAFGLKGRSLPLGMEAEGERASYIEGVVEGVGEITIEGCPRYTIRPFIRVHAGEAEDAEGDDPIHPPVNGTPSLLGGMTCGVEVIEVYDEFDQTGPGTWHARLLEKRLEHFWDPETAGITQESDGFWTSKDEKTGQDRFATLQAAKDSFYWEMSLARHMQKKNLLQEADLPDGWTVNLSDGIAFIGHVADAQCEITGCQDWSCMKWNAWMEDDRVPGDHPTPREALAALHNWSAARKKNKA